MRQRFANEAESDSRGLALVCAMLPGAGLLIATFAFSAESRPATTRPTTLTKSCADRACHTSLIHRAVRHRLKDKNACLACHHVVDARKHTFRLPAKPKQLCGGDGCHNLKLHANVHKPIKENKCTSCHDPHGSDHKGMLRPDSAQGVCFSCHPKEAKLLKEQFVHDPVRTEACVYCHEPHSSEGHGLLKRPVERMCVACHRKLAPQKGATLTHPPAKEQCISCHDPHAGNVKCQLVRRPPQMCLSSCHKDVRNTIASHSQPQRPVHGALTDKDGCTRCHVMHFSRPPMKPRLHAEPGSCLACHDRVIKASDGRALDDMAALLKDNPLHHAPIRQGSCTACHRGHVSDNEFLLSQAYPPNFYSPFKPELYVLCFQCHDPNAVLKEDGTGLTGFRDGRKNLHYSHVNKRAGRTCRACHEVHASKQPFLIRQAVPYGPNGWMLDINFKQTPTGGQCDPACHKPKSYNHGLNPEIPPATMPATTVPTTRKSE